MDFKKLTWPKAVPLLTLLIVLLATSQDYLQSVLLDRGFYISESLLFKLHWLLFIPAAEVVVRVGRSPDQKVRALPFLTLSVITLSLLHLLFATALMTLAAKYLLSLPFTFSGIGSYLFSHELFSMLLMYSLILGGPAYISRLKQEKRPTNTYADQLTIRQGTRLIPLPLKDICWIRAAAPYVDICADGKRYLHQTSLKQLATSLDPELFIRIHRSSIVNIRFIRELRSRSNGDYDLLMQNGTTLRWSRHYHQDLKKALHLS